MRRILIKNKVITKALVLLLLVSPLLLVGCEDVIEVDLKNAGPQLVVEGYLSDQAGNSFFLITRSTDFYNPQFPEMVSGAFITISDDGGNVDTMFESPDYAGLYINSEVVGISGHSYMAMAAIDGQIYSAATTMPIWTPIDSLATEYQEGGGFGSEEEEGYRLHVYFTDNAGVPDYNRIKLCRNQEWSPDFYLYDGKFSDSNVIDYEYFLDVYQAGDTVTADLISMDKKMYDYFLTLSEVVASEEGGNSFDATPANPNTNWSGDILGYFGAFYVNSRQIIVQ